MFSIDVAAYAVMSNHYHVVLRGCRACAQLEHRRGAAPLVTTVHRPTAGTALPPAARLKGLLMGYAERAKVDEMADTYRARLFDLSWYMRVLNESIARQANAA